jgi:hypothetical protein
VAPDSVVVQRLPVAVAPATAAPAATAAAATAAAAMAEIAKLNCTLGKLLGVEEGRPPAPASMYEHIGRDCAAMRREALRAALQQVTRGNLERKLYTTGLDAQGGLNARRRWPRSSPLTFARLSRAPRAPRMTP